jgi:hypothetical protein
VKKFGKKNQIKIFIDCTHPVEDGIMNCSSTGGGLGVILALSNINMR